MRARILSLAVAACLMTLATAAWADSITWDQTNTSAQEVGFWGLACGQGSIGGGACMGQSFAPTLTSLDTVQLLIGDVFPNGVGSAIVVEIHWGTISGPLVGITAPSVLPDQLWGVATFNFSSPVPLQPGNVYVLAPVLIAGDIYWGVGVTEGDLYAGGSLYDGFDLWFQEGVQTARIPEPATLLLLSAGLAGLWLKRRTG